MEGGRNMMYYTSKTTLVCLLVLLCWVVVASAEPPSVPRITERALDQASYVRLAKEWKKYIAERGETATALVNLGTAYWYSGEKEAALIAGRRAVEIAPEDPDALAFLGSLLGTYGDDPQSAMKLLERCVEIAPDHKYGLFTLAAIHLKGGDLAEADEVLKAVFDQRIFASPLEDFGYNLLVGLPQGAVLVTNGDSDTFSCLALQAGMSFRTDVAVVNRHLLRAPGYAEAMFERYPAIRPGREIAVDEVSSDPAAVLRAMVEEGKAPVYFACSVPLHDLGFEPDLTLEGLSYRSLKKGLTAEESARLVLDKYRLDSATDWGFAWDIVPSVSKMMTNYPACMIKLAQGKGVSRETRERLLERASAIAEFHNMDSSMLRYIESLEKKK
jgi:tetratricopeptide (TPR) repeat protein